MQIRVECRAESNAEQRARRPQQKEEQNKDESRLATRAVLRPEQHWEESRTEAQRRRGAEAQRRRCAKAQRRKPAEFRAERRKRNTSRNAGEKRSYIGSARVRCARGDCSQTHTRRDAHLASLTPLIRAARAHLHKERARAQHRLRGAPQPRSA